METETLAITYVGPFGPVIVAELGREVASNETIVLTGAEEVAIGRRLLLQGAPAALDAEGNHRTDENGEHLYEANHAHWKPAGAAPSDEVGDASKRRAR